MTCHIKANMRLPEAMQRAQRFQPTTIENLMDPTGDHQRKRLDVILLSCKPAKKQTFSFQSRQSFAGKRRMVESTFHRFFSLKIVNSAEVVGIFTKTEAQSITLLQYWKDLRPGVAVSILNPTVEGFFNASNNILISTINPLINCAVVNRMDVLPPTVLNVSCNDYIGFSFVTSKFSLQNIILRNDLCNGVLCDGQVGMRGEPCGCVALESRHIPVLEATIKNEALNGCDNQFENVIIRSRALTFLMVNNPHTLDLRSELYDELLFEDTVLEQIEHINNNGGVRITGWVKPSNTQNDSEAASTELKKIHVVAVEPVQVPTEEMINTKFSLNVNPPETLAANMIAGHATNAPSTSTA